MTHAAWFARIGQMPIHKSPETVHWAGVTLVTWTAMDPGGNTTHCIQRVAVTDGQAPDVLYPADLAIEFVNARFYRMLDR